MKKVLLFFVLLLLAVSLTACSGDSSYLEWKAADYNSASDAEKLDCLKAFTNAALAAQGAEELSGNELTVSAQALQSVLESSLAQYPNKTVEEIIAMASAAQSGEESSGASS